MINSLPYLYLVIFILAISHTLFAPYIEALSHRFPKHHRIFHLLAEVEIIFGAWAFVLTFACYLAEGKSRCIEYIEGRNYQEAIFVFSIMLISASKPIIQLVTNILWRLAYLSKNTSIALYFLVLFLIPLLGSLITEPAAMTISALILSQVFLKHAKSDKFKYFTLGTLFVNVSLGGCLTNFAAPPIIMVAKTWQWDNAFMLNTFGWKAMVVVFFSSLITTLSLFSEINTSKVTEQKNSAEAIPLLFTLAHVIFLVGVVYFSHYPVFFLGIVMLFLGVAQAYPNYHSRLMMRESLLVAFFLSGLVVIGGKQEWWLTPYLMNMSGQQIFWGALSLTAITDNAAITYLASLVPNISNELKYAIVAGAISGGGLTIIANAPNPVGVSILKKYFSDSSIHPGKLLLAALPGTVLAVIAYTFKAY